MAHRRLQFLRKRTLALCALAGLLMALSFPTYHLGFLGFVCLVPLLFALADNRSEPFFGLGLTMGLVLYSGTFFWVAWATLPGALAAIGFSGHLHADLWIFHPALGFSGHLGLPFFLGGARIRPFTGPTGLSLDLPVLLANRISPPHPMGQSGGSLWYFFLADIDQRPGILVPAEPDAKMVLSALAHTPDSDSLCLWEERHAPGRAERQYGRYKGGPHSAEHGSRGEVGFQIHRSQFRGAASNDTPGGPTAPRSGHLAGDGHALLFDSAEKAFH
jgi:hypothetical protein